MKKIVFSFIAIVSFTLMSFSDNKISNDYQKESSITEIEVIDSNFFTGDVNCKWRTCYTYNDGTSDCSDWTYGKCTKDAKGKLTPIITTEDSVN